jgi:plasmid stability protein
MAVKPQNFKFHCDDALCRKLREAAAREARSMSGEVIALLRRSFLEDQREEAATA